MNTQELIQKTHEKFSSVYSFLDQTATTLKEDLRSRLLVLHSLLTDLINEENNNKRKMYLFYALMYVDSALDNLGSMDPEYDRFVVWETKWAIHKAFEIFKDYFKDYSK